jgi:vesicle-fusing ATPase
MSRKEFKCDATPGGNELAKLGRVYLHESDFAEFKQASPSGSTVYVEITSGRHKRYFVCDTHEKSVQGTVGMNMIQRTDMYVSKGDCVSIVPFQIPQSSVVAASFEMIVEWASKASERSNDIDGTELLATVKKNFKDAIFVNGQELLVDFNSFNLKVKIAKMSVYAQPPVGDEVSGSPQDAERGMLTAVTEVTLVKNPASNMRLVNLPKSKSNSNMFRPDFSFSKMGIGGLDTEIGNIFRRAFASRVYPSSVMAKLGVPHVKGMLLYGPPGCGKTLIAREIGKLLNGREPKIVNGPEVLDKYVGGTEQKVRDLFKEAEEEQAANGDDSELHVIILDELDAICKQRGSVRGDTGVHDSIVNQLLSKIDGVKALNNILLIGMTNRKDMIDEALLRPGRLEVHMEIGLPDEKGRVQILTIKTKKLRENDYLGPDVNLEALAATAKNFSGAELEGVVKSASSYALERNIDPSKLNKAHDDFSITVTMADFERALTEITPAFGVASQSLGVCIPNGIIDYGFQHQQISGKLRQLVQLLRSSDRTPIMSILLEGPSGSGKTALACQTALDSGFPFTKMCSPEDLVGHNTMSKMSKIVKTFEDAYKSPFSIVILDDIEHLLEYVQVGPRFSNEILQTLQVLVRKAPPNKDLGVKKSQPKLLVIGTTSSRSIIDELGLAGVFMSTIRVNALSEAEAAVVMQQTKSFSEGSIIKCQKAVSSGIAMKSLLNVIELAKQSGAVDLETFTSALDTMGH